MLRKREAPPRQPGHIALELQQRQRGVLRQRGSAFRIDLLWLLAIGVLVQFGWEAGLPLAASAARALRPSAKSSVP